MAASKPWIAAWRSNAAAISGTDAGLLDTHGWAAIAARHASGHAPSRTVNHPVVLLVVEEPQHAPLSQVHGPYAGCLTHPEESGEGDDGKAQAEPVEGGPDAPGHEPEGDQLGP